MSGLFKKIQVFFLFLMPVFLYANIEYKGICGSYQYDLNISSNKYYGAFCDTNRLLVYYDGSGSRDYIRGVYTDPTYPSIDIYSISTGRTYKSFTYPDGSIKNIGSPSFQFLAGLAGLIVGFSFLYVVMRIM